MPDWAVVLVAAFGGGLAGAVLQPLASHVLERIRRDEEVRRRRERHLRRMIEGRIESMRGHRLALALVCGVRHRGDSTPSTREVIEYDERQHPPPRVPAYIPERIPDPDLRQKAIQYGELFVKFTGPLRFQEIDAEAEDKLLQLTDQIEPLEEAIILRMDELNWPEADE